jgi:hypothetical protein
VPVQSLDAAQKYASAPLIITSLKRRDDLAQTLGMLGLGPGRIFIAGSVAVKEEVQ